MAGRIRTIKPEILEDERSAGLSSDAWRLWVSMWLLADDHGRLRGAPSWLRSQVFWACPNPVDVDGLLSELDMAGVITRYEVNGQRYIEIPGWRKHQKVDHPGNPRVPAPCEDSRDTRETVAKVVETLASHTSDLRPPTTITTTTTTTTTDLSRSAAPPARELFDLDAIYALYPRKGDGKAKGLDRLRKQLKTRDDYEQALKAARHYAEKTQAEQTPLGYVKRFDSWSNGHWRDYVDGPHVADGRGVAGRKQLPLSSSVSDETRKGMKF